MLRERITGLFIALALPVWGYGLHQTMDMRRIMAETSCQSCDDFARYEALRPHLEDPSLIIFIAGSAEKPEMAQYFRAQYTLAPAVVYSLLRISSINAYLGANGHTLDDTAVILYSSVGAELEENLAWIHSEAERRGLAASDMKLDDQVILVTFTGER